MSRNGYVDDMDDQWALIRWRGAVSSAIRGDRGQKLLRDLLAALDAIPNKRLIVHEFVDERGDVCALGALGQARKVADLDALDPYDSETIAKVFGIAPALAREIMFENDEQWSQNQTPEQRWERMRAWVASLLSKGEG